MANSHQTKQNPAPSTVTSMQAGSEPIYQVYEGKTQTWLDATKRYYDQITNDKTSMTRIVYLNDRVKGVSESNSAIQQALDCITEEINPNNYTHDLVHQFVNEYNQMVEILLSALNGTPSDNDAIDAERFRWLVEDHDDKQMRNKCRDLLNRLGAMSYSAACMAIDAARKP